MLDENIWAQLSESEKFLELESYLNQLIAIEKGKHELSNTEQQGRIPELKKQLEEKIFKIIDLENAI